MRQTRKRRRKRRQWPIKISLATLKMRAAQAFCAIIWAIGFLGIGAFLWQAWEVDRYIDQQIQKLESRRRGR